MILPFSGKLSAGAAHVCATMSQSLKAVAITFDSNILRTSRLCYKRQSQTSLLLAADHIKKITFFLFFTDKILLWVYSDLQQTSQCLTHLDGALLHEWMEVIAGSLHKHVQKGLLSGQHPEQIAYVVKTFSHHAVTDLCVNVHAVVNLWWSSKEADRWEVLVWRHPVQQRRLRRGIMSEI